MKNTSPTRSEIWFRLCFSIAGLAFLAAAVAYRGMPSGPAMFEVIAIAGVFFGGTLIWSVAKLVKTKPAPEQPPED